MYSCRSSVYMRTLCINWSPVRLLQDILMFYIVLTTLIAVSRAEVYKLPLKKMSFTSGSQDTVVIQRSRAKRDGELKVTKNNLDGEPGLGYFLEMGIGTPPQMLNVLLDTGSSNFAVASAPNPNIDKYFNTTMSSTYSYDGTEISVTYTQGEWIGPLANDKVTAPSIPSINISADIAFITDSTMFFQNESNWQGILGLAYAEIIQPDDSTVVPFMDSLIQQTNITAVFSMQLCGVKDTYNDTAVSTGGTMTLGGVDTSLYQGPLLYASLRREWYYEVIITDILVDGESLQLDCKEYNFDRTIVDSGTTDLRLPPTVFTRCVEMLKRKMKIVGSGGSIERPPEDFWVGGSVLCWEENETPWLDLPTLTIQMAVSQDTTFDLVISPQQYLLEVKDTYDIYALNDCYKFAIAPSASGTVLGAVLMEGFYVVFDRQQKRVGFAQTSCSMNLENAVPSSVQGPHTVKYNTSQCGYVIPQPSTTPLSVANYIIISLAVVCLVPLLLFVFQWVYHTHCKKHRNADKTVYDENNLLETDLETR